MDSHCHKYEQSGFLPLLHTHIGVLTYSFILFWNTSDLEVLLILDILSHRSMLHYLWEYWIFIIDNLHHMPCRISMNEFMTTNSAPKVHISIIDCLFQYQLTNAVLRCVRKPVQDLCICYSPTWSLSMNILRSTAFPIALSALWGIDCLPYYIIYSTCVRGTGYCLFQDMLDPFII